MTTIVAIFDVASDLDRAIEGLSQIGIGATVLDQSIESAQDFKTHLAAFHLPSRAADSYLINFAHGAKFVLVSVDQQRAAEVVDAVKKYGAEQIHRHES